jgi:Mrp family chromosome partitioning ATPase
VVVSTPQAVALADAKRSFMFMSEAINVPVLIIENMAYFTPSYLITSILFGKKEQKTY